MGSNLSSYETLFGQQVQVYPSNANNVIYFVGNNETQESECGEADLHKYRNECKKNPGHTSFIPVDIFNLNYLCQNHPDRILYELIKVTADLTVRVDVKMTSERRSKFWPHTNIPYAFYGKRGSSLLKTGTGCVERVYKFKDGYRDRFLDRHKKGHTTCWCKKCQRSDEVSHVWWEFYVHTAAHVVFDNVEASHTSLRLFYDREDSPVVRVSDVSVDDVSVLKDLCMLSCVTCDGNLGDKLTRLMRLYDDTWWKVSYKRYRDVDKIAFIVSHPHGCCKQVTVGHWVGRYRVDMFSSKCTYTTCTCPGSSGALVHCVGYSSSCYFVHSGALSSGLNFSGTVIVWRVTNNYVCKGMEYVRHFLTYMAHLGLLSYSFELPLRQGYTASRNHVRRASYGIFLLSAVCSLPVVFLFKIDPASLNNTLSPVLYVKVSGDEDVNFQPAFASLEPNYCHMTFNFDTSSKYYELIEYAKKMYYGINTLLYSAGLFLFVYKVILFIDARPMLGQDSIFIQTVIDVRENSFSMPPPTDGYSKYDKRKVSTTRPMYLFRRDDEDLGDEPSQDAKRNATGNRDQDAGNEGKRTESREDSVGSSKSQNNNFESMDDIPRGDRKVSFGDAMVDSIMFNPDESTQHINKLENKMPYTRPILKSSEKPTLKISSYKKSMMFLIFLDLLVITLTVIVDLAIKNSSTVMNCIHLKSIFSFYVISLTNKDLRAATWGRYFECCNKFPSSKRTTTSSTGPEFFGSNVRPELMRAWGRYSYEGTASEVSETSNVSGVSDIPVPVLLQDRPTGGSTSNRSSFMTK